MKIGIIDICKQIEDPRMDRKSYIKWKRSYMYPLLLSSVVLSLGMRLKNLAMLNSIFKSRIPDLEVIPSHDTFNRFFSIIKPSYFELIFRNWVKQVCQEIKGVVAIDGKLMRGPSKCNDEHTTGKEGFKLWMVSAWSAANGISLGQVKVDDKSNEITAVPLLIHALDLDDCIVTIDAMGCQLEITKAIIERNSNYIIALKKNQKSSYELAKKIIDGYENRNVILNRVTRHTSESTGHGRIETRVCTVVSYGPVMEPMFKDKFAGLRSIVGMKSERIILATGNVLKKRGII